MTAAGARCSVAFMMTWMGVRSPGGAWTSRLKRPTAALAVASPLLMVVALGVSGPATASSAATGAVATVTFTETSMNDSGSIEGPVAGSGIAAGPSRYHEHEAGAHARRGATPAPTFQFLSGTTDQTRIDRGGSPADSNLAVSRTHICTTTRAAFACYSKGGALVAPAPGLEARGYSAQEFFAASGVPIGPGFDGSTTNVAKDGRILYDPYRDRFFMVFQSRESPARLMIAVSRSEDPRDGWFTYGDVVGRPGLEVQDYQKIGMTSTHFLVSSDLQPVGGARTTVNFLYSAGDLAEGRAYTRGEWSHVDAWLPAPALNQSASSTPYWASRDSDTGVSIWAVSGGSVYRRTTTVDSTGAPVNGTQLGGQPVVYNNIGRTPQNADLRGSNLTFVSTESDTWSGQPSANSVVKLVQVDVSNYFGFRPSVDVVRDRRFGRASVGDPAGAVFDYGWPAVASNANSDLVVSQIRSNSSIYPELRASVWDASESDISSSVRVASGSSPLQQFHMAGAATDPSTTGVYVSQQVGSGISPCGGAGSANGPCWVISIGKILGQRLADLIAPTLAAPAVAKRGGTVQVITSIANQGDESAPSTRMQLRLSSDPFIASSDANLGKFKVPALPANALETVRAKVQVPARFSTGKAYIGAVVDVDNAVAEQSAFNNSNPFLVSPHGNTQIRIKR